MSIQGIIENWQKVVQTSDNLSSAFDDIFSMSFKGRVVFLYCSASGLSEDFTLLLMLVLSLTLAKPKFGQSRIENVSTCN